VWTTSLITAAASEPLDLAEVASHLRLSADERTAQETLLSTLLASARDRCERFTGRALISRELELWLSHWWEEGIFRDGRLRLPWPVVSEIDTVKYLDPSGVLQTFSAVTGWAAELPEGDHAPRAEIYLRTGQCYPPALCQPGSIAITYTTGYGDAPEDVPGQIKHGLLIWIAEAYARREEATQGTILATNPIGAERCWQDFRRSAA
jgi:uncharacterized phiE125 gp8 family phage protein